MQGDRAGAPAVLIGATEPGDAVVAVALEWDDSVELVELVVDRILDPVADVRPTGDFARGATMIATALYDRLRDHPGVANELMSTQRYPSSLSKVIEMGMEIGVEAGFDPAEAAFRVNLLAFFTIAATSDLGEQTGDGSGREMAIDRMSGVISELPSGPLFAEYITYWLGTDEDELFRRGLDVMIAGMLAGSNPEDAAESSAPDN